MPEFTTQVLNRMLGTSVSEGMLETHEDILERTAEALKEAGAERVRYYQIAAETAPELDHAEQIYLMWLSYSSPESSPGLRIPLSGASISRSITDGSLDPIIESAQIAPSYEWIGRLGLEGRTWIDVLVRDRSLRLGVLSFDWRGSSVALKDHERNVLRMAGQLLGAQLTASAPRMAQALQDKLPAIYGRPDRSHQDFVERALMIFRDACQIASISLFEYSWVKQSLKRVWHYPRVSSDERADFGFEVFPIGTRLTGQAFVDESYHSILDFQRLNDLSPELVSQASVNYHKVLLGEVHSVAYARIGRVHGKYLVRAIDRTTFPELPLIREAELLRSFALDLSPYVDAAVASNRAELLKRLQESATQAEELAQVLPSARDALSEIEGIDGFGIAVQRHGDVASRPHEVHPLRGREENIRTALAKDSLWLGLAKGDVNGLRIVRRQDRPVWAQLAGVKAADDLDVAVWPLRSGDTFGALVFGVSRSASGSRRGGALVPDASRAFVEQVASTLADAAERTYVLWQAKGALEALSLVGHEMTEPMAATKELALRAVDLAKVGDRLGSLDSKRSIELHTLEDRLRRQIESLDAAMRLCVIVGRQIDGEIVGVMRPTTSASVMNFAISRINREREKGLLREPEGGLRVHRVQGQSTQELNCDAPLLEMAIVNLLRNAIKYSIPQRELPGVYVKLTQDRARSDRRFRISVRNIGPLVPMSQREVIFDAFTRANVDFDSAKRRGMGLGLYLARQVAKAHGGTAYLASQSPTSVVWNGSRGWDTEFVIEVRGDLKAGPYPSAELVSSLERMGELDEYR